MGHGWKEVSNREVSRKKCKCGQGEIITYKLVEESDYPPFERDSQQREFTCPNKCYS